MNMLRIMAVLVISLVTSSLHAQRISVANGQFEVDGERLWINGANTPWIAWNDFGGDYDSAAWEAAFQDLAEHNVNATRVWITCNGEAGFKIDSSGHVSGMTTAFWKHLDDLFALAQDKKIYLMVALISFNHSEESHENFRRWRKMYASPANRQAFVDNFVIPLVDRYKTNPYFWAIDVGNELDWTFDEHNAQNMPVEDTIDLVARVSVAVHARSEVLVTKGTGTGPKYYSPLFVGNLWNDASLSAQQAGAYLDFYKPHYYPWMDSSGLGNPYDRSPSSYEMADKPVVIGEFPASGSNGNTPAQAYKKLFERGYAGAMAWTSNGVDDNGDITDMGKGTRWFYKHYPQLVYPQDAKN